MNKRDFIYRKGERDEDLCVQGSHLLLVKGRVTLSLLLLATCKGITVNTALSLVGKGVFLFLAPKEWLPHAT